jgi:Bacterial PH domain
MSKNVIPSSYDRQTVWFLPLVFLLLLFVLFVAKTGWVFQVSMILIFLISSFGSFILIPHQIQQNEKDLILKRFAGDIRIKIEDIEKIEIIDFSDLRRKIGIHGLLGYYGYYNLAGFGQVRVMAKAKHELLLIQSTQFEPVVVSVDDSRELETLLNPS